jgi:hypothetical protein
MNNKSKHKPNCKSKARRSTLKSFATECAVFSFRWKYDGIYKYDGNCRYGITNMMQIWNYKYDADMELQI